MHNSDAFDSSYRCDRTCRRQRGQGWWWRRLSDQELVAQLADLSKQLGVDINVNYSFVQQLPATQPDVTETDGSDE